MKVLFVSSESYPFIKTGGLGDVTYALPKALRKLGVDVRVIIPKYSGIDTKYLNRMEKVREFNVRVGWREKYCGLLKLEEQGVPFYFIDNEYYFKRIKAYGDYDDGEKFVYFSRAVLEAINYLDDFVPDVVHCNDWHAAISIPILKDNYKDNYKYKNIKTVYTIHNLKYQGVFKKEILEDLVGLSMDYYSEDKLKYYDDISFMKGGIMYSDIVSTVSPTYAEEIKTEYFGEGLHGLLAGVDYKLYGILNGIDMEINNPQRDSNIFFNYDERNLQNKQYNKEELQRILGLPVNKEIPMIGMVTRLEEQKGLDLVQCVIEDILKENLQIVVLGTGDKKYEDMFKFFAWKYPDKVSANIYFDSSISQKIYAASDMFLMPSKFEPCGIGQLIALRYGSIPIVRETGGLNDTVKAYNEFSGEGNGFTFKDFNAHDMLYTIKRALGFYKNKGLWINLAKKAMQEDNSWNKSAQEYINIYNKLVLN
ncbi:glycogen synthase GlgA [Clostridium sp. MB40-C1]|uniref:glycogen synthase GlgA n=1 Tax=Clostridium sp. MB40-C1 TaxID=3070996 RepID=UPI0027E0D292|nr:glycogen synthase GlgA [Clostridium sp. MB40-C1]WMJ80459.1 glycogen synthase GlgA [Clostridium sp. MB40-C1]